MSIALPNTVAPGATNGMTELKHIQVARSSIGLKEIPGSKHAPEILQFWKDINISWGTNDEIAWCAAFVGSVLKRSGLPFLETGMARNYMSYVKQLKKGQLLKEPCYGAIAVMWTGSKLGTTGHVGFVVGVQKGNPNNIMLLAGNQGNKVGIDPFSKDRMLGYIWPSIAPTPERYELPVLDYKNGSAITTR